MVIDWFRELIESQDQSPGTCLLLALPCGSVTEGKMITYSVGDLPRVVAHSGPGRWWKLNCLGYNYDASRARNPLRGLSSPRLASVMLVGWWWWVGGGPGPKGFNYMNSMAAADYYMSSVAAADCYSFLPPYPQLILPISSLCLYKSVLSVPSLVLRTSPDHDIHHKRNPGGVFEAL